MKEGEMTAAASYEAIGKILRTKPDEVEALVETITDPKAAIGERCAALDRYVEVRKAGSLELLTVIVEDFDQPEELRAHCQHWLLDPRVRTEMVATRGAVRTRGAVVQTSGAVHTMGEIQSRRKTPGAKRKGAEPSERLRWLKSL
jgi:hypothetical protein